MSIQVTEGVSRDKNPDSMYLAMQEARGDFPHLCDLPGCEEKNDVTLEMVFTPQEGLPFQFYFCCEEHLLKAMKEWKLIEVSRET